MYLLAAQPVPSSMVINGSGSGMFYVLGAQSLPESMMTHSELVPNEYVSMEFYCIRKIRLQCDSHSF